jgi:hypothetical protein
MRIDKAPTALGGAMVLALKYRYAAIAPTGLGEKREEEHGNESCVTNLQKQ